MKNFTFSKFFLGLFGLSLVFLLFCNCSTSKKTASKNIPSSERDQNLVVPANHEATPLSWENLFRKVPGVVVGGTFPNLSLRIRGANSINMTTQPLYVLEGVPLGHSFRSLSDAVSPGQVKSIKVLKGPDATMYGSRGSNGVIVVKMKNHEN